MTKIIQENIEKLLYLTEKAMDAVGRGDVDGAEKIQNSMVELISALDEGTIKELNKAIVKLQAEKEVEFAENRKRRQDELAELDAIGKELDELNALTAESIKAAESGNTKRVAEIEEILKKRSEQLEKGFGKI